MKAVSFHISDGTVTVHDHEDPTERAMHDVSRAIDTFDQAQQMSTHPARTRQLLERIRLMRDLWDHAEDRALARPYPRQKES